MSVVGRSTGFVIHRDGRWYLATDGEDFRTVDVEGAVGALDRCPPTATDGRPRLPGTWIGEIDGGVVRVKGTDVVLSAADLRYVDRRARRAARGRSFLGNARRVVGRPRPIYHGEPAPLPPPSRSPLRSKDRGRELLTEGWTTLPLLSPSDVERLREAYGRLHGWSGEGFEPDPANPDADYRRAASTAIREVIDEPFRQAFDGFHPFLRSFYCKWPQMDEIHLHWDWASVDEAAGHRAYQVWIALQDTSEINGQMLVVPRSHRLDPRPRGSNLAIPLSEELAAIEPELRDRLVAVPLRAGEAVIFDLGLIHISSANRTDEPRLAAAVIVKPDDADLRYYRGLDEGLALQYDVDEAWYNRIVPEHLMTFPPDLAPSAVVDLAEGATATGRLGVLGTPSEACEPA